MAAAVRRGCGPRALGELLAATLPRAQTPGLLVRVAADATPDGCPPDSVLADHDAVAGAWQAGRDRMSVDHPDEHPPAGVAALAERSFPGHADRDRRLQRAFLAGWSGHPLTATTGQPATSPPDTTPATDADAVEDQADIADAGQDDRTDANTAAVRDELRRRYLARPTPAMAGRGRAAG